MRLLILALPYFTELYCTLLCLTLLYLTLLCLTLLCLTLLCLTLLCLTLLCLTLLCLTLLCLTLPCLTELYLPSYGFVPHSILLDRASTSSLNGTLLNRTFLPLFYSLRFRITPSSLIGHTEMCGPRRGGLCPHEPQQHRALPARATTAPGSACTSHSSTGLRPHGLQQHTATAAHGYSRVEM
jgi:hypothetical protein